MLFEALKNHILETHHIKNIDALGQTLFTKKEIIKTLATFLTKSLKYQYKSIDAKKQIYSLFPALNHMNNTSYFVFGIQDDVDYGERIIIKKIPHKILK